MAVILYSPAPVRSIKHHSSPQLVSHTSFLRFKLAQLHKPPVHTTFPAAGTLASTPQLMLQPLLCKVQPLSHAHSAGQDTAHLLWNFVFNLII